MRPKVGDENYKSKIIHVRMSETDYVKIQKLSKRTKATSVSDFMRQASILYAEDYEKLKLLKIEKNPIIRNTLIDSILEKRTLD